MPNGSLVECYDELGTRYAIPVYCLSYPVNIVFGGDTASADCSTDGRDTPADESEPVENGKSDKHKKGDTGRGQHYKKEKECGKELKIRVRISLTSSSDKRLLVNTSETVLSAKKRLYAQVRCIDRSNYYQWALMRELRFPNNLLIIKRFIFCDDF